MKQIIYVFMAIVMVASVSAINVDCGSSSWWNPMGKYCEANELQADFDQVESMIDDNSDDISDVQTYVSDNEVAWLKDSSGTSFSKVERYLFSDFVNFLKGLFVTKSDFEQLEDKYYTLLADGDFNQAVLLEMDDKGLDVVEHGKYTCSISNNQLICMG